MSRKINFRLKRLLNEEFFGDFESRRRGFEGYEIEVIRKYQPGDPPEAINPRLSARRGMPMVKITRPPTGFTGHFICDFSRSMEEKRFVLLALVRILAEHISDNNAHFACSIVTSRLEMEIMAGCGTAHVTSVVRKLEEFRPQHSSLECASIGAVLRRVRRPPQLVFIFTDLLWKRGELSRLSSIFRLHDVIFCIIREPAEEPQKPLRFGTIQFMDVESEKHGVGTVIGAPDPARVLSGFGVDWQEFSTGDNPDAIINKLIILFERRKLRATGESQKGGGA